MKTRYKHRFWTELSVFILGLLLLINIRTFWYGQILLLASFLTLILDYFWYLMTKKESIRTATIILLLVSILNILRHVPNFIFIIKYYDWETFEFSPFIIKELIWLIPTFFLIIVTKTTWTNKNRSTYKQLIKSKRFKIAIGVILVGVFLELPIWGIHGDFFGQLHGHSFWNSFTHIH